MCHILYWIYLILLNTEKGQYLPFKSKIIIGTYASFMKINPNRSDVWFMQKVLIYFKNTDKTLLMMIFR